MALLLKAGGDLVGQREQPGQLQPLALGFGNQTRPLRFRQQIHFAGDVQFRDDDGFARLQGRPVRRFPAWLVRAGVGRGSSRCISCWRSRSRSSVPASWAKAGNATPANSDAARKTGANEEERYGATAACKAGVSESKNSLNNGGGGNIHISQSSSLNQNTVSCFPGKGNVFGSSEPPFHLSLSLWQVEAYRI